MGNSRLVSQRRPHCVCTRRPEECPSAFIICAGTDMAGASIVARRQSRSGVSGASLAADHIMNMEFSCHYLCGDGSAPRRYLIVLNIRTLLPPPPFGAARRGDDRVGHPLPSHSTAKRKHEMQ